MIPSSAIAVSVMAASDPVRPTTVAVSVSLCLTRPGRADRPLRAARMVGREGPVSYRRHGAGTASPGGGGHRIVSVLGSVGIKTSTGHVLLDRRQAAVLAMPAAHHRIRVPVDAVVDGVRRDHLPADPVNAPQLRT